MGLPFLISFEQELKCPRCYRTMNIHSFRENKYSEYTCSSVDRATDLVCDSNFTYERSYDVYIRSYTSFATDVYVVMLDHIKATTTIKTQEKFFDDLILKECNFNKWLVNNKEMNKIAHMYKVFS